MKVLVNGRGKNLKQGIVGVLYQVLPLINQGRLSKYNYQSYSVLTLTFNT